MEAHPYRTAWESGDLGSWLDALADDVMLHSPVIGSPFVGRQEAADLFVVLFEKLGNMEITDEFAHEDGTTAFFWRADAHGRRIEGADLIRLDASGKIGEIRVLIRPLADIAAFAAEIGPPLAARRGPLRGWATRVAIWPLGILLRLSDRIATWLIHGRSPVSSE